MTDGKSHTITIDGVALTVLLERKRVKHVNARLRESVLSVSAPLHASQRLLDQVIPDLARRLLRRERAREVNVEDEAAALARRVAQRFPNSPEVAVVEFVTTQRARWGSYSPITRTIRLHAALREMPHWVLEAVIAHELAHTVHHEHNRAFWALVRKVCPKTDSANAFLDGVTWFGRNWEQIPPVERALLAPGSEKRPSLSRATGVGKQQLLFPDLDG